ncbi:hypothetical protein Moror_17880 [Moniliophthora roreri MCA 2997]|uniref:Uncharacterized protein n=1 Tax=Moniliophthora roreri (strain MCA 2997) TaxID=1381753 RepID=V2YZU4_MONRO|nr:hypothetical protein Moror_17880 [Moniliophthora roreri MCA 2997]
MGPDALKQVSALTSIVASLGGPNISPKDIEWVMQVERGRNIVEWLASQVKEVADLDGEDSEEKLRAALSQIALEKEEVDMLKRVDKVAPVNGAEVSAQYLTPSKQRERVTLLDNLSYTMENEVDALKNRIQQTKLASQRLSRSVKKLKTELQQVKDDNVKLQERLSDLSIENETAVSNAASRALEALDTPASLPKDEKESLFQQLVNLRAQFSNDYKRATAVIDGARSCMPSAQTVEAEANRLHTALYEPDPATGRTLYSDAEDALLAQEMLALSRIIDESDGDKDTIYDILQTLDNGDPGSTSQVDIKSELETAWYDDQMALLEAREAALKKAIFAFDEILVQPLQELKEALSGEEDLLKATLNQATALRSEMDEICARLSDAQAYEHDTSAKYSGEDSTWERQLIDLLKQHENLRPKDAPPLVLLDSNDLLSELRSMVERANALDKQEEDWISSLACKLNTLQSSHHAALLATYAHSPLNTSQPYAASAAVEDLRAKTKTKGDEMIKLVQRLQSEVKLLESDRTQRKLKSFVERWVAGTGS